MSSNFYVSTRPQSNGDYEVHRSDCTWLPTTENRKYLGLYSHCKDAVSAAKRYYYRVNGCKHCSNACHSS